MKFAIAPALTCQFAEVTFSPPLTAPVTDEAWMQTTQSLEGCIAARHIQWLYSLVSVQGDRSICVYAAPYADAVREAYREAGMSFQQIYPAEQWFDQEPKSYQDNFLIVAEVRYDPPLTKSMYESQKQQAAGCFHELNIQYAWSVLTLDGTRSHCVFSAACAEDVRSLYRKLNAPFDLVWKAILIQPQI
ncbi:hypothetical protein DO97_19570 [Neosynechococcus sphagnicola sy1]|uniref:DUF4242 domain-containing protein n=1 Tax=Neosynechococcus sphagnicola sy1 TaxID=1497020 RepID=A0A098TKT6_9CYAN|nr:nickel-binding protein [Neosynechococcus sphagnicola]KGF71448.1 hypothetical protein DO97_19570 [Neosynechococcus sphagnicola sy1]